MSEDAWSDEAQHLENQVAELKSILRDVHRAIDRNALLITRDPALRDGAVAVWERVKEAASG